jgi:drug/metabolite transporter (DMT)-like permease
MKTLLLLASLIAFSSLGEILSARAMKQVGEVSFHPRKLARSLWRTLSNRTLLLAVICLALSFFSFLGLLSYADLSYVLPLTAISYVTNTIGAKLWLREEVSRARCSSLSALPSFRCPTALRLPRCGQSADF